MSYQGEIQKFLYNLSTGDFANADKSLKSIVENKVKTRYDAAYNKVAEIFSKKTASQTIKEDTDATQLPLDDNASGAKKEIDPETPIQIIDKLTGQVVRTTTYKNRRRARAWATKKDLEYGAYRYVLKILFKNQ